MGAAILEIIANSNGMHSVLNISHLGHDLFSMIDFYNLGSIIGIFSNNRATIDYRR